MVFRRRKIEAVVRNIRALYFALLFTTVGFFLVINTQLWPYLNGDPNLSRLDEIITSEDIQLFYSKSNCPCRNYSIGLVRDLKFKNVFRVYEIEPSSEEIRKARLLYKLTEAEYSRSQLACNLYSSLRRGKAQKVVAYSLYGRQEAYYHKIANLSRQIKKFYPDWFIRVYYDESIRKSVICEIECLKSGGQFLDNVDFCHVGQIDTNLVGGRSDRNYIRKKIYREI